MAQGATPGSQEIPGDGFSVITVGKTKKRAARFVGQLPDAAKYSSGSPMRGANYTVFSGLYKRKILNRKVAGGQTLGLAEVTGAGGGEPEIGSRLTWGKGFGVEENYYPNGFERTLFINGALLYPKVRKGSLPPIGLKPGLEHNATLRVKRGNLVEPFEAKLSIEPQSVKVLETSGVPAGSGANPHRMKIRMNVLLGTFSGSFIHPASGEKTKFAGALQAASGFIAGEGRGSFRGSVDPENPAQIGQLPESGSVRIDVKPE